MECDRGKQALTPLLEGGQSILSTEPFAIMGDPDLDNTIAGWVERIEH